jgi:hypothetical protein
MKYYSGSRLSIYEGPGEVTTLAAIRQILRMRAKCPSLSIVSDYYLSATRFNYSPVITKNLVPKDNLLLMTLLKSSNYNMDLRLIINGLIWYNNWLILVCNEFDYLDIFIKGQNPTVYTYAGGGVTGSVFVKNARSSTKKEYYRLQKLSYYRKYM